MNFNDLILDQINLYRNEFKKHGDDPKSTFQNDLVTQYIRFKNLIAPFQHQLDYSTIHEIGVGTGSFYNFLQENNYKCNYSGTEIVPEMVEFVKKKYPKVKIFLRDILTETCTDKYDFTVLSGVCNLSAHTDKNLWQEFCYQLIKKMFHLASKAISFNFLTTYKTFTDKELFYMDPKAMYDFCMKNLSRYITIDSMSPLYEYTVTVYHEEYIQSKYTAPEIKKYFKK